MPRGHGKQGCSKTGDVALEFAMGDLLYLVTSIRNRAFIVIGKRRLPREPLSSFRCIYKRFFEGVKNGINTGKLAEDQQGKLLL